jgi:FkbM family methyltransferase
MKEFIKRIVPRPLRTQIDNLFASSCGTHLRISYSQEGEDLLLERLFDGKKSGFYVDVGAHHPRRFSNTFRFYKLGWNGINIEPNPDALKLFQRTRKRDINVGLGVADTQNNLTYFMFNEPALNSFDRSLSEERQSTRYQIIGTKSIPVRRLSDILEDFLPSEAHIDFMSIDVEGYDFQVLKSNDWARFRPTYVLVESAGFDLIEPGNEPIHTFLQQQHYKLFAKTLNTLFYVDQATDAVRNRKQAS